MPNIIHYLGTIEKREIISPASDFERYQRVRPTLHPESNAAAGRCGGIHVCRESLKPSTLAHRGEKKVARYLDPLLSN